MTRLYSRTAAIIAVLLLAACNDHNAEPMPEKDMMSPEGMTKDTNGANATNAGAAIEPNPAPG